MTSRHYLKPCSHVKPPAAKTAYTHAKCFYKWQINKTFSMAIDINIFFHKKACDDNNVDLVKFINTT